MGLFFKARSFRSFLGKVRDTQWRLLGIRVLR